MTAFVSVFQQALNMSLTSVLVIAVVCLLRLCLKKAPKKFSFWLWAAVCFRLVCPFSISAVFSLFSLSSVQTVSPPGPVTQVSYFPAMYGALGGAGTPGEQAYAAGAPVPGAVKYGAAVTPFTVLAILWALGIAVLLGTAGYNYLRTRARVSTAVKLYGNVYESDAVCSPFVLGFFQPRIYIPFGLDAAQKDYILCHESAHIKRGDHLIKPLAFFILAVHWFNPVVWLAFHLMSKDMEMSCDEKVLEQVGEDVRQSYSLSLLSFAENRRFPAPNPLAFGETSVKERVKNVMAFRRTKRWVSVAAAVACILVTAACSANPAEESSKGSSTQPASSSQPEASSQSAASSQAPAAAPQIAGVEDEVDEHTAELLDLLFASPDTELEAIFAAPSPLPSVSPDGSSSAPEQQAPGIGVIGGADGPTQVYIDSERTEKLDQYLEKRFSAEYFTEGGYENFLTSVKSNWTFFLWASDGARLSLQKAERQTDASTQVREWNTTVAASLPDGTAKEFEIAAKIQEEDGKIVSFRLGEEYMAMQEFFQRFQMEQLAQLSIALMEEELEQKKSERDALDSELSRLAEEIQELESRKDAGEKVDEKLENARKEFETLSDQREELGNLITEGAEQLELIKGFRVEDIFSGEPLVPHNMPATPPVPTPERIPSGGPVSNQPAE